MHREDENGIWEIRDGMELLITPSEEWILKNRPTPTREQLLIPIRQQRNYLLAECDWTQFSDSPLTIEKKTEWVAYRQLLRDLPTIIDVNNPIFPEKPI